MYESAWGEQTAAFSFVYSDSSLIKGTVPVVLTEVGNVSKQSAS